MSQYHPPMAHELDNYKAMLTMLFGQVDETLKGISPAAMLYVPFVGDAASGETASAGWFLAHGVSSTVYLLRLAQFAAGQIPYDAVSGDQGEDEFTPANQDPERMRERSRNALATSLAVMDALGHANLDGEVPHPTRAGRTLRARYCITHAIDHLSQHIGHAQVTRQIAERMGGRPIA